MTNTMITEERTYTTKASIKKWGNSQGIRIPKNYLDELKICENETVELSVNKDTIVIKKCRNFNNLGERLEAFYKKPLSEIYVTNEKEVEWGGPEGEEVW